MKYKGGNNNNNLQLPLKDAEMLKMYEESDHFTYLLYHRDCRALIGKANILNRFDDWEAICHNCKKIIPVNQIKFVRIEKK
ncbi:MAG: hypothetical protein PHY40_01740 [Patescibacteria group bacterium]|nr:hypothetical protein [Patescibacteria group bacterium]